MTSFYNISALSRELISLLGFIMCVMGLGIVIYAAFQKRWGAAARAFVVFAVTYVTWHANVDINSDNKLAVSELLGGLPWLVWIAGLAVILPIMVIMLRGNIRYERNFITTSTIKTCTDRLPCGICYWRDSGHVVLANRCMNRLCAALTNQPLQNGNIFREALSDRLTLNGESVNDAFESRAHLEVNGEQGEISDGYVTLDGKTWRFSYRELALEGAPLYEMIASDVTEEYLKAEALKADTAELERINRELQEYRLRIADTVRKQEILQAKVNIHDEMNRLMLMTVASDPKIGIQPEQIFALWKKNALLLCMEAEADRMAENKCEELARQMNIRLIRRGELPAALTERQKELYFAASHEAIINAAKHAKAGTVTISYEETDDSVSCIFENDGEIPGDEVKFTGGLRNMALLAKRQNAFVTAESGENFRLIISFTKNK